MRPPGAAAPQAQFPMSPQVHWQNRIQEVTVKNIKVTRLERRHSTSLCCLEYADPTEDPDDAAALEFMVGDKKAHFAHGQPMAQVQGGPVNIWYWKNKDGKGVDMSAMGFGTLKAQAHQDVKAKGVYANGDLEGRLLPPADHRTSRRRHCSSSPENSSISRSPSGTAARMGPESRGKGIAEGGLLLVVFPR